MAVSLAKQGYAVFPCSENKMPSRPKSEGGRGFLDASKDEAVIRRMWGEWRGPFIGVATGKISGISALDIDVKHDTARAWWHQNYNRLPDTRVYRTRSGGLHLLFQHIDGVRNSQGKLANGVDTRGDGGYIIWWAAAGFPCEVHAPPAVWPAWLFRAVWPPEPGRTASAPSSQEGSILSLVRTVKNAIEGSRNAKLYWAAKRMEDHIARGEITKTAAKQELLRAGLDAGLTTIEANRTLTSALGS